VTRDEHEKMRLIRRRVEAGYPPMTAIASELGEDIDALCGFIIKYREPPAAAVPAQDGRRERGQLAAVGVRAALPQLEAGA
jgi:hypothetical protein